MSHHILAVFGPGLVTWASGWYWRVATATSEVWSVNKSLLKHLVSKDWSPPASWPDYWQRIYEVHAAPKRAMKFAWLYWPYYAIAKALRIKFVVNIVAGMGHNTVELDYFFRRLLLKEWPDNVRFVLVRPPNAVHRATIELYGKHFWIISESRSLYNFLLPLLMRYWDITVDCGLSRLKWQLRRDLTVDKSANDGQTFLHQISKAEVMQSWAEYYRVRELTLGRTPLSDNIGIDQDLLAFLGGNTDKLALVHIKLHVANATAAPTDPTTYVEALRHLQDRGYRIVFVGREPIPEAFKAIGVLNYAESPVASYKHDLQIFSVASIAITAGSGIALIPDCMEIPLVYLDSWHIAMPLFSSKCVTVPALVTNRETGRPLSLAEQIQLYRSLPDHGDEIFPNNWQARNATTDEIKAAVDEALILAASPSPRTTLQDRVRELDADGLLILTQSRISQHFLLKHQSVLFTTQLEGVREGMS